MGERYAYYQAFNIKQFIGNALMLHNMGPYNFFGRFFVPFGSGRPLWTIAVEWWLYMLFGAVFLTLRNKEKVSLSKIFLFGIIVLMISDYLIVGRGAGLGFVFALGILTYYGYRAINSKASIVVFSFSCMLYIVYGLIVREAYTVYSFIMLWLIFSSALKMGIYGNKKKRNPVIAFISKSTFMLYLIHYSIIDLLVNCDISWSTSLKFAIGILCSLLISFLTYYVFGEKDLMGLAMRAIRKDKV